MAWDAGSITSVTPWADLSQKIKDLIAAAGSGAENWEFVENIPAGTSYGQSGSSLYSVDVFRCNGKNTKVDAFSAVNKLSGQDSTDANSYTFAGVGALSANKVYIVSVVNRKTTLTDSPASVTLDGADAPTFYKIADKVGGDATGILRLTVWMAKSGVSAPAGTNLTVDFSGANQTACSVFLNECTGLDATLAVTSIDATGATQIVVQAATANGSSGSAQTVTLAAPLSLENVIYHIGATNAGSAAYTYSVKSGWVTATNNLATTTPQSIHRDQHRFDGEDLEATLTLSSTSGITSWAGIALELQRSSSATSFTNLNDAGDDWYFGLQIPASDGAVTSSCNAFHLYSGGQVKAIFGALPTGLSTAPVGSKYWASVGWYLYNSFPSALRTIITHHALNTTGFNYWIKITNNGIIFATRVGDGQQANGFQLLDSFVTNTDDPMPLVGFNPWASANIHASTMATLPGVTGSVSSHTFGTTCLAWTIPTHEAYTNQGAGNTDLWADSKIHVARLLYTHHAGRTAGSPGAANLGYARGLIKTDFLFINTGGTVSLGDTMTIKGNTWTCIGRGYMGYSGLWFYVFTRAN